MTAQTTAYPAQRSLASGFRTVNGWIPALALFEVAHFAQWQHRFAIRGPVCEIARLRMIIDNSLSVSATRILETCGGQPRLFSPDGGRRSIRSRVL